MGSSQGRFAEALPSGLYSIRLREAHSQKRHVLSASNGNEQVLCLTDQDDGTGFQKWVLEKQHNGNYKIYTFVGMEETSFQKNMGQILAYYHGQPILASKDNNVNTQWKIVKREHEVYEIILVTYTNNRYVNTKYLVSRPDGTLALTSKVKDGRKRWGIYAI